MDLIGGEDKRLKKNVEFLLIYVRNRDTENCIDVNQAFDETELSYHIRNMREDNKSWKYTRAVTDFGQRNLATTTLDGEGNEIKIYRHSDYKFSTIAELLADGESEIEAYKHNFETVFRDTNAQSSIRTRVMESLGEEDGFFSIDYIPRSGRNKGKVTNVYYKGTKKDQIAWLHDIARFDGENILIRGKTGTLWADFNWNNVSKEGDTVFPNGKKPIAFIQRMLQLSTKHNNSDIVLDFFSGSASTAHAVVDMNKQDAGNRKFIMIQLPEPCTEDSEAFKAGFKTVSDIGIERIRRVAKKLNEEQEGKLNLENDKEQDRGFRVLRLNQSNFKQWQELPPTTAPEKILEQLEMHIDHISHMATQEDLLFEILIKAGVRPIEKFELKEFAGKKVFSIADGALLICLEDTVSKELIDEIAVAEPQQFICLDAAFGGNDQLKANSVQTFAALNMQKETHNQIVFRTV